MPIVNYIREHEWFIEYAADEGLTPNDVALYDAILHFANRKAEGNNWPDDFIRIRNDRLLPYCHMGFDAMARSRNKLKQKGIIDFLNGNRNSESPAYKILYKCLDDPENGVYPQRADKTTDKHTDKTTDKPTDKSMDKPSDKPAVIIPNYTGDKEINQNGILLHTALTKKGDRARGRLDESYTDAAGKLRPCRFDGAFLTSDKARMAVVQRILDQFNGKAFDCENAHARLTTFLHDGMPPEIMEDEIGNYDSLRNFVAEMAGIFHGRHYEEKRDALEMKRCMEQADGNRKIAELYYRSSGRYIPEEAGG